MRWVQLDDDNSTKMTIQWWQFDDDDDDLTSSISFDSQDSLLPLTTLTKNTIQQDQWFQLRRQLQWNDWQVPWLPSDDKRTWTSHNKNEVLNHIYKINIQDSNNLFVLP